MFRYRQFNPDDNVKIAGLAAVAGLMGDNSSEAQNTGQSYDHISPDHIEFKVLNKCIQNYINLALESYNFPVYKVECMDKKGQIGKNRIIFYFVESLYIGQEVSQAQPDSKVITNNSENYKEKFKSEPSPKVFDLNIRYAEQENVTLLPEPGQLAANYKKETDREYITINKRVVRFGLNSCPSIKDHDIAHYSASPNKPLLMSIMDDAAFKLRNTLASDQDFSKNMKPIQESVYKGLYTTAYVADVEVSTNLPNQRIVILVDGRTYGEYGYIRVTPVLSKELKRLVVGIKTFCPFHEGGW